MTPLTSLPSWRVASTTLLLAIASLIPASLAQQCNVKSRIGALDPSIPANLNGSWVQSYISPVDGYICEFSFAIQPEDKVFNASLQVYGDVDILGRIGDGSFLTPYIAVNVLTK
ncbi:hypothetical protein HDU97_004584 [Phlyctochytrium planicorne]|nr:hypothetical protein HDU97_004584 [Phlyctochytrium planicorne]